MTAFLDGNNGLTINNGFGSLTLTSSSGGNTLTATSGNINITAASGFQVNLGGIAITGPFVVNGDQGLAGQVLTSAGPSANAYWSTGTITLGTTPINLGATQTTLAGLVSIAVTQNATQADQLVTKGYVDAATASVNRLAPANAATVGANIILSGTQTIDGVALVAGNRVLVKDQTTASQNGVYDVAAGPWSRSSDNSTWAQMVGALVFIINGSTNANTSWVQTAPAGGTIDVTPVAWTEQSAPAVNYQAGMGLALSANIFSNTGVLSLSAGTTGLTVSSATGAITLDGTLATTNGGTGLTTVGTNGQALIVTGGVPAWGTPSTATNIDGGTTYAVPYQAGVGATTFLAAGTANLSLLTQGPGSAPVWGVPPLALTANYLTGGSAGSIPYQSASNVTAFLAAGSAGQYLQSNGAAAPSWVTSNIPQLRFEWDTWTVNGTTALSAMTPPGTLVGNWALGFDSNIGYGVDLTSPNNGQYGNIYWNSNVATWNSTNVIDVIGSFAGFGGTGADGYGIYFGASNYYTTPNQALGGIVVFCHYYAHKWEIYVNGVQTLYAFPNTGNTNISGLPTYISGGAVAQFVDMKVRLYSWQGKRFLSVYWGDSLQLVQDISSWTPGGNYFGAYGETVGLNAYNNVRSLKVEW